MSQIGLWPPRVVSLTATFNTDERQAEHALDERVDHGCGDGNWTCARDATCSQQGHRVIATDLNVDVLANAKGALPSDVRTVALDVADSRLRRTSTCERRLDTPDALVNMPAFSTLPHWRSFRGEWAQWLRSC